MKVRKIQYSHAAMAAIVAWMVGGCGGGGGGDGTAVSGGTTPAPSPSPAPSPAPSTPAAPTPVPATPVPAPSKPPPGLVVAPPPAAPTPSPAPGAARTAVVRALMQASDQFAIDSSGAFDLSHDVTTKAFSTIRSGTAQQRLTAASTLTLPGDDATPSFVLMREVVLSAAVATDGVTNYTFTGTGSITSTSGQTSIGATPYSLPDPVPFDRTLHQLNVTGSTTSSVRFFVGTIDNRADLMRVCWRFELPGILRVACTRHLRTSGDLVGGDTVDDLGGTLYYHDTESGDAFEPTLLRCTETFQSDPNLTSTTYRFGIAAFDRNRANGGLLPPPARFYSGSVSVPGTGQVEYRLDYNPPANFTASTQALTAGDRVQSVTYGSTGSTYRTARQCN